MNKPAFRLVALLSLPVAGILLAPDGASAQGGERCYALSVETWEPPIEPAADTLFHQPPAWFGLTTRRHTETPGYEVRPTIVIKRLTRQVGTWLQQGPDVLVVRWDDLFTGVLIEFDARADTLVGVAHIRTDMQSAPYARATARARAVPRPCPPSEETEVVRGTDEVTFSGSTAFRCTCNDV